MPLDVGTVPIGSLNRVAPVPEPEQQKHPVTSQSSFLFFVLVLCSLLSLVEGREGGGRGVRLFAVLSPGEDNQVGGKG